MSRSPALPASSCLLALVVACGVTACKPQPADAPARPAVVPVDAVDAREASDLRPGEAGPHTERAAPSAFSESSRARARELVAQMTLEEKAAALVHVWDWSNKKTPQELCEQVPVGAGSFERIGLYRDPATTARFVNELRDCVVERSRLGIPPFFLDEGLHGFMQKGATSFPAAVALGATWNPELLERIFNVVAREARVRGTSWILGPNLDLAREPRWGRSDEMYGEDPYHVARLGVAAILGLQGRQPFDDNHLLATAKHFAAHGQPEAGANGGPMNIGERVLRGEFFVPFEAAVNEAGVGATMAAYTEIDGVPGHINSWLLKDVLRTEWGFQGVVISDGAGVERLQTLHRVSASPAESARRALMAGVDYEIGNTYLSLAEAVDSGQVPEARLNEAVERTLTAKFALGLFDAKPLDPERAQAVNNAPEHQALALEAARQGAVLLKNEALLPLDPARLRRVAVIGPNAAKAHFGSYSVDPGRSVSLLDGVRARLAKAPRKVDVRYARGCNITAEDLTWEGHWKGGEVALPDPAAERKLIRQAVRTVRGADVAIVAIGENEAVSRETWDNHLGDRDTLELLGAQNALVEALAQTGVPLVLVAFNGRPLAIGQAVEHSKAAIEAFYLGQETGTAMAEILFGDISPSGRLPISMPRSVGQLPIYYYRKPSARGDYLFSEAKPLLPFGWGLTYTTFSHSAPTLSHSTIQPGQSTRVTLQVQNTGKVAAADVVQLYVGAKSSSVTRPVRLLRGFERVQLNPGETREVSFEITPADLALWDAQLQHRVEPGQYVIEVGANVEQLVATQLTVEG